MDRTVRNGKAKGEPEDCQCDPRPRHVSRKSLKAELRQIVVATEKLSSRFSHPRISPFLSTECSFAFFDALFFQKGHLSMCIISTRDSMQSGGKRKQWGAWRWRFRRSLHPLALLVSLTTECLLTDDWLTCKKNLLASSRVARRCRKKHEKDWGRLRNFRFLFIYSHMNG